MSATSIETVDLNPQVAIKPCNAHVEPFPQDVAKFKRER